MNFSKLLTSSFNFYKFALLFILFAFPHTTLVAQDSAFIKVVFLYGSKPAPKFRHIEPRWFGGMLGGHVGVEVENNEVFNFNPNGKYHLLAKNKHKHSQFGSITENAFWNIFGGKGDSVKGAIVVIPISQAQKVVFDSIVAAYLQHTPYDYAFLGMRCAAAAYDILARMGITQQYCQTRTFLKIFYPAKLRHRLFAKAAKYGWEIIRQPGSVKRKWEGG